MLNKDNLGESQMINTSSLKLIFPRCANNKYKRRTPIDLHRSKSLFNSDFNFNVNYDGDN